MTAAWLLKQPCQIAYFYISPIYLFSVNSILDPFAGSGTTVLAAVLEGYEATGIEMSDEYARLATERIEAELKQAA